MDTLIKTIGYILFMPIGLMFVLLPIGELYWFWMAIQMGSFGMVVFGIIPPFFIVAAPVGTWSMFFGPPTWVINWFG